MPVSPSRGPAIEVDGFREFRRDLKRLAPTVDKEMRGELRDVGRLVVLRGAQLAPRGPSGRLSGSLRASVTQREVAVRSPVPYANVIHWGGTTGPGHRPGVSGSGSVKVKPSLFLTKAVEEQEDRIVEEMGQAVDRAAAKTGWR